MTASVITAQAEWHALPVFRRLMLYGVGAVMSVGILFWGRVEASSVAVASIDHGAALAQHERLVAYAVSAETTARDLATKGLEQIEGQQTELGAIFLEAAGTKDPKYRDANVYAGYAELALADTLWDVDPTTAEARTKRAVRFLEVARQADPIHAYTFELLAVGYENLGQATLAADARVKAEKFKVASES
ncbi:MAG: hypothetical protein ACOYBJ_01755 [Patescibacteria group bacterium]|jgi:hypothetical protein